MDPSSSIDVVIVNFNGGPGLSETVTSVLIAGGDSVRVIVVDNASQDDSIRQLESATAGDGRVGVIRNRHNRGFAVASNQGIESADASLVLLLNPDCRIEPDTLDIMMEAMTANPGAGMAGCLLLNADGSEQRGGRRRLPRLASALRRVLLGRRGARWGFDQAGGPLPDRPTEVEAISGAFMLVRRKAIDEVGLLDEGYFLHCEDLDWCRRFHERGWKTLFVPNARAWHQQGHSSSSRPVRVMWHKHRGMWRYFRKFEAGGNPLLAILAWLGIHLRAVLLAPFVALRWLRP